MIQWQVIIRRHQCIWWPLFWHLLRIVSKMLSLNHIVPATLWSDESTALISKVNKVIFENKRFIKNIHRSTNWQIVFFCQYDKKSDSFHLRRHNEILIEKYETRLFWTWFLVYCFVQKYPEITVIRETKKHLQGLKQLILNVRRTIYRSLFMIGSF